VCGILFIGYLLYYGRYQLLLGLLEWWFGLLEFEELTHTYKYNGKIVPSVTQVMSRVGVRDNDEAPFNPVSGGFFVKGDTASNFGKALHTIAEAMMLGKTVTYDPQMKPWVKGVDKFMADYNKDITVEETETMHYSKIYGYCGTWDLGGLFKKLPLMLDWKSSVSMPKTAKIQTAAYEKLRMEKLGIRKIGHRFAVRIFENGYEVEKRFNQKTDFNKFLSLLNVLKAFGK